MKGDVVDELRVLTLEQVAERVQLSAKTVMRAIRAGDLEASQLTQGRGGWRVREDAIAGWLEARSNRADSRPLPDVRRVEQSGPRRPSRGPTPVQTGGRLVA
jgi:excisionase family DNA binding protein